VFVKVSTPQVGEEEVQAVRQVLLSGQYVSGQKVAEFERRFAEYVGVTDAVAVNSGTAALHAALAALDIGPGDEVIVPALTFFATATAVIHQGAVPVFADITLKDYCLSADDLPNRITPRTKAIIPVHYFGYAADMAAINTIARKHGLKVIEDCAQSHGTRYRGVMTGALGDLGAFSLFATKHMTTGEGGIVTTNDRQMAARMRVFRSHGLEGRDDHVMLGYNYRMTEMAGAIGLIQLGRLDALNDARIRRSEQILRRVADVPWLTVIDTPNDQTPTYFWCPILIDEEKLGFSTEELIVRLRNQGVETRHRYVEPLYKQPLLNDRMPKILRTVAGRNLPDYGKLRLPNSERVAGHIIGLPNRPDMSDAEVDHVVRIVHSMR
jgi:dTDP-4-amino-4,6-dideoxygalactose transaminase